MSVSTASDAQAIARATRSILKGTGAQLAGKKRGRDIGEGRRVPRRHSYEVNDPRARPWAKIGDGSFAQGAIYREALLKTAKELRHQLWKDLPNDLVREAREQHAAYTAEFEQLRAQEIPPTGRLATIRMELGRLAPLLERARLRLRRVDLTVLDALLEKLDFRTGMLCPSIETIAEAAACHRNSVVGALQRLKAHGLIDWVRRTVRTDNEGEFGPQLEQTSNAYHFDHRRQMEPRVWQRYWQILISKLRRLGAIAKTIAAAVRPAPVVQDKQLADTLKRLEALVPNAST